jgi:hypothetical protein
MKKLALFLTFYSLMSQGQVNNKIEGITINAPCEIEYTRNINNQNNYTCNNIKGNTIINYTIHVSNLFNDMNGLSENSLKIYKKTYLKTAKENAEKLKETTEYIKLFDKIDALTITALLDYSGTKFKNTSVMFIYRKKSYIVNLVSNDMKNSSVKEIIKRIKI